MARYRIASVLALVALSAGPTLAQTELQTIWNCREKDGRTLVTSLKEDTAGKECRIVQQTRVTVVPATQIQSAPAAPAKPTAKDGPPPATKEASAVRAPSPAGFPRETPNDRTKGKEKQRQMIEGELSQEEQLLAQAKRELAEQESIRGGDERNYAKVLERLQKYRDNVEVHEKNIEALKRELANLYR